jgi:hypothetical protein
MLDAISLYNYVAHWAKKEAPNLLNYVTADELIHHLIKDKHSSFNDKSVEYCYSVIEKLVEVRLLHFFVMDHPEPTWEELEEEFNLIKSIYGS